MSRQRARPPNPAPRHRRQRTADLLRPLLVAVVLAALAVVAYWPVRQHQFVNFDDPDYVVENEHVTNGLTWRGARWAFSTGHAGNWHPLTWLSHMADVEYFGMDPGAHHVVNLTLHVAATMVLFAALLRMTRAGDGEATPRLAVGASAFVAAVFALHPLHVESVAWIAERKDVLSGLFFMLTLWAYVSYLQRPRAGRYVLLLIVFALGLMAKPMLVTLPFVLWLLTYWPLGPLATPLPALFRLRLPVHLVPMFALAAASSVVTLIVQQRAGAVKSFEAVPFAGRLTNAAVAYVEYIVKGIWPSGLAPIYPYPASRPLWLVAGAVVVLAGLTTIAFRWRRERPYVLVGWLWYLGMLVPVIGLVQVGSQPIADRYTYLPFIGLSIGVAWGVRDLTLRWPIARRVALGAAVAVVAAWTVTTRVQAAHWRGSVPLWEHTIAAVAGNYRGHVNLGHAYELERRFDDAITQQMEALRIKPDSVEARNNLGSALLGKGRVAEAVVELREAVRLNPAYVVAHNNLGLALAADQKPDEALAEFQEAARLNPAFAPAQGNLGVSLATAGRLDEAIAAFVRAMKLQPLATEGATNLARAYTERGRRHVDANQLTEALTDFDAALAVDRSFAGAHHERGRVLSAFGRNDEALRALTEAVRLAPTTADFYYDTAVVLVKLRRYLEAAQYLEAALTIDPKHVEARAALEALAKIVR